MAWEIAVIVDPCYDHFSAGSLDRDMPIWIVDTPENQTFAKTLREAAKDVWLPNPICTTFQVEDLTAREQNCLSILGVVAEHHPWMAKLNVIGINDLELLRSGLAEFGFVPFESHRSKAVFVRPLSSMKSVPRLHLDASNWKNTDDIYESLFTALGAPTWHGKNFNALNDSIANGYINTVEVPYTISIQGMKSANREVQSFVSLLVDFASNLEAAGCPISIQIENN